MEHKEEYISQEGATGGEEQDYTSVKSVTDSYSSTATNLLDGGQLPLGGRNVDMMNNFLSRDVDLRNNLENSIHAKKCNETFIAEQDYNKKPVMTTMSLNIPVAEEYRKEQNDQSEFAMAEMQPSFQSRVSEARELPAMPTSASPVGNESFRDVNRAVTTPGNDALVTSGALNVFPLNYLSNEENKMASNTTPISNSTNSTNSTNRFHSTNTGTSATSCASRYSMRSRQPILDNMLITDCPNDFIEFLSTHFNGRGTKNWRGLLSIYNWTFKQINLFRNRDHPDGYFCSILQEVEFQEYTVEHLKEDLETLPRKDILSDVNKWIEDYNQSV